METLKFVDFEKYCQRCAHYNNGEDESPCDDCLEIPARLNTHKPDRFVDGYSTTKDRYKFLNMRRLKDYLFDISFDDIDYEYAKEYFKTNSPSIGACSCVRNGRWYGRNLDWTYDNQVEFVVHVSGNVRRFASIGVAGGMSEFTKSTVVPNKYDDIYKIVPFCLQDGINEKGVVCNMNVVPHLGHTIIEPYRYKDTMCVLMLVRYILDNFDSATAAVNYIKHNIRLYNPDKLTALGYDVHFMVADEWNTYVIEFIDGITNIISNNKFMTNFHLTNVIFNEDGSVITPETRIGSDTPISVNHIHPLGSGLERYNLINERYNNSSTKAGMIATMERLKFSRAYKSNENVSNPYWYTEFVGTNDLTCASLLSLYSPVVDAASNMYRNRSRETGRTWHTVHTSIYDIIEKKLYLRNQEQTNELEFAI